MAEEVAVEESAEGQVAQETVSQESVVGTDGKFTDGWKEMLREEIRGEKCLNTFDSLDGMANMLVHSQKMVGKDKVVIPSEISTETEWAEFHRAIGRPETAADYVVPEEMAEGFDPVTLNEAQELFFKEGLTKKQADALFEFDQARLVKAQELNESALEQQKKDAEETLKKKWGPAYDEKLHLAKKMIADNTDESIKEAVFNAIGNSSEVAEFLSNIASKFIEGGILKGEQVTKSTPLELGAMADELRSTPGYLDGQLAKASPAKHAQITAEIASLYEQMHPEPGS